MSKHRITDKDFSFRCCWTCVHCELDIVRGYECVAMPRIGPIAITDNVDLHRNRDKCKAYKRG